MLLSESVAKLGSSQLCSIQREMGGWGGRVSGEEEDKEHLL